MPQRITFSSSDFESSQVEIHKLSFTEAPDGGSFVIRIDDKRTPALDFTSTATIVQDAINSFPTFSEVTVTGNFTEGYFIKFGGVHSFETYELVNIEEATLTKSSNPVLITVTKEIAGKASFFSLNVLGEETAKLEGTRITLGSIRDMINAVTPGNQVSVTQDSLVSTILVFEVTFSSDDANQNVITVQENTLKSPVGSDPFLLRNQSGSTDDNDQESNPVSITIEKFEATGWEQADLGAPVITDLIDVATSISSFLSTVQPVIDVATTSLEVAESFLFSTNAVSAIAKLALDELEKINNDFFGSGAFMLTVNPYRFGMGEVSPAVPDSVQERQDSKEPIKTSANKKGTSTKKTEKEQDFEFDQSQIEILKDYRKAFLGNVKLTTQDEFGIPIMTPGQCLGIIKQSLDDTGDKNRPQFSDDSTVAGFGILMTAPGADGLLSVWEGVNNILNLEEFTQTINDFYDRYYRTLNGKILTFSNPVEHLKIYDTEVANVGENPNGVDNLAGGESPSGTVTFKVSGGTTQVTLTNADLQNTSTMLSQLKKVVPNLIAVKVINSITTHNVSQSFFLEFDTNTFTGVQFGGQANPLSHLLPENNLVITSSNLGVYLREDSIGLGAKVVRTTGSGTTIKEIPAIVLATATLRNTYREAVNENRSTDPNWNSFRFNQFGIMKQTQDLINETIEWARGQIVSGEESLKDLISILKKRIEIISDLIQDLNTFLEAIINALKVTGIYIWKASGIGGNEFLKDSLSDADLQAATTKYTVAFILVAGGPHAEGLKVLSDLFTQ